MVKKIKNILGMKKRTNKTPKQVAKAGMTLSAGYIAMPFIPFKKASKYSIRLKGGK